MPVRARPLRRSARMCAAFGWLRHAELDGEIWRGMGLLPDAARALPNTAAQ
jgi:hypothetical protein